jgi:Putative auto-transporter adhesin, head GIN domain
MKYPIHASVLLLSLGLGSACNLGGSAQGEVRQPGSYSRVTNDSDADVVLVEADDGLEPGDVEVFCDSGLTADINSNVDADGNLVIDLAANVATALGCEVHVVGDGVEHVMIEGDGDIVAEHTLTDFQSISVSGNGSIHLATVEADVLEIKLSGNGAIVVDDVSTTDLVIVLSGDGDATLAGTADDADLTISGSGSLWAEELTVSGTLDAVMSGAGSAAITVNGTVNADIDGSSTLDIYGSATAGTILEVGGGVVVFH